VILGADFLTKTGIDVKYSTDTIEWFNNALPLSYPHDLKDRDFKAMAEIIDSLFWYGLVQPNLFCN
jgi:hypothetical protein